MRTKKRQKSALRKSSKLPNLAKSLTKQVNKRKSKYNTLTEKRDGKRKCNRESYHRRKVLKQVKPNLTDITFNYDAIYQKRMFLGLKRSEYHVMVTLTNHDCVTLKKHNSNIIRFLNWLEKRGFIGNSFKINEKNGGNYHSHILLQLSVTIRSITGIIKKYWEDLYGYVDVMKIVGQEMKERVIKYVLKQLKPTSCQNSKQELIDTWELRPEPKTAEPEKHPDLFKNKAFLASLRSAKRTGGKGAPRCIILESAPLKIGKREAKTHIETNADLIGIY